MRHVSLLGAWLVSSCVFMPWVRAEDWPGFRGVRGGVGTGPLPTQVTKENVQWKVKLPGVGTSSPIIVGEKIFLTAYIGYGEKISKGFGGGGFAKGGFGKGPPGKGGFGKGGFGKGGPPDPEQKNLKLLLVCLDRATGSVAWKQEIEPKLPEINFSGMMREHGYASHTPVSDGERIYAFLGKSGVVAFDFQGKKLWQADVGSGTHTMGSAASPVLFKDLLIVNASIESKSLVALEKTSGKERWRTKGLHDCWASPILVETEAGKTELVMSLPGKIAGFDPDSGKELWHCTGIGTAGGYGGTSPTPVAHKGIVYAMGGGGFTPSTTIAVKTGGTGDVDKTHVVWRQKTGASYCSPVIVGEHLCWVDGTLQCLKLADGASVHKERLYDARGEYVSAVAAGNHLYALTRYSGLFVVDAGKKFEKVSHHEFDGDDSVFNASPAISDGKLYLRSNAYLYCMGK